LEIIEASALHSYYCVLNFMLVIFRCVGCGGKPILQESAFRGADEICYRLRCDHCGFILYWAASKEQAVEDWNKSVLDQQQKIGTV